MADTIWQKNVAENFNRLSRMYERYRQTTDGRATAYSEKSIGTKKPKHVTSHVFNVTDTTDVSAARVYPVFALCGPTSGHSYVTLRKPLWLR